MLAQGDPSNEPAMDTALGNLREAAGTLTKAQPDSEDVPRDERLPDTAFEIDAQLIIPPAGYGLTAVRRFRVAVGRRRHTNRVPLALLFGRAASATPESAQARKRRSADGLRCRITLLQTPRLHNTTGRYC